MNLNFHRTAGSQRTLLCSTGQSSLWHSATTAPARSSSCVSLYSSEPPLCTYSQANECAQPILGGHSLKTHWFPSVGQASLQTKHFNVSLSRTPAWTPLFHNSLFEGNSSRLIAGPRLQSLRSTVPPPPPSRPSPGGGGRPFLPATLGSAVHFHALRAPAAPPSLRAAGKAPPAATVPR